MIELELSKKYKTILKKGGIDTPLRLAHFFAQIGHESGLKPRRENMNYSAKRLLQIFPRYFTSVTAKVYANNPEKIANKVYASRMGNGPSHTGDGYKFRGGGFLQHTGKNEYAILSKNTGIDYLSNPELLSNEADAMIAAIDYWKRANLNYYADLDALDSISDLINIGRKTTKYGDSNGFADRRDRLVECKKYFQ